MFYYLTVSYDMPNLIMSSTSDLSGPFGTAEERDRAVIEDMSERDLECTEIVNVTKLKLEDGKLVSECSFLAEEVEDDDDDDDEDDY